MSLLEIYRLYSFKIRANKTLFYIISLGAILRLCFLLFGAEIYFDRENIFFASDTLAWQRCFENLLNNGTYSLNSDSGYFCRMPGFAFYIGLFYLIAGNSWDLAMQLVGYFQTGLDIFCIYIFYQLVIKFFNRNTSLVAAFLYAIYPFVIVWNPVAYAELISNFLIILSLFYYFKKESTTKSYIFSGFIVALACLMRPQVLPLSFLLGLFLFVNFFVKRNHLNFKKLISFLFAFGLLFGSWPLRNYINHNRIIITKNAEGFSDWEDDVISFMQFTYAVKTDWDPQYSTIVQNKTTTYPNIILDSKEDSILLEKAIYLSKNCGSGFSQKLGYWKNPISKSEPNCNKEISKIFNNLREKQINKHPFNFYFIVPIKNLCKALFKNKLYGNQSTIKKLASTLFYFRTALIILGLLGLVLMFKNGFKRLSLMILLFFCIVYFTLCFGTSPFMRNIEMRYFLSPDILLIIPASFLINKLIFINLNLINEK